MERRHKRWKLTDAMDAFKPFIAKVATGAALIRDEARAAFEAALALAENRRERDLLRRRADEAAR